MFCFMLLNKIIRAVLKFLFAEIYHLPHFFVFILSVFILVVNYMFTLICISNKFDYMLDIELLHFLVIFVFFQI